MIEAILIVALIVLIFMYWQYILLFISIVTVILAIYFFFRNKTKKQEQEKMKESKLIEQKKIEELKLIEQEKNRKQEEIKHEKQKEQELKRQMYINDCKKNFNDMFNKIYKVDIKQTDSIYKKQHLYEMPEIAFSTIRKNSTYKDISNFIVIDVETTGLRPKNDDIIEVSAIKFVDKEPIEYMSTLINPKKDISEEATAINNITNEMVSESPEISSVIDCFSNFIKGFNIVGYNLEFDLNFLYVNHLDLFSEKRKFYDLLPICRRHIPKDYIENYKLNTVCEHYHIYRDDCHRSASDALATGLLFIDISEEIKDEIYNA